MSVQCIPMVRSINVNLDIVTLKGITRFPVINGILVSKPLSGYIYLSPINIVIRIGLIEVYPWLLFHQLLVSKNLHTIATREVTIGISEVIVEDSAHETWEYDKY